MAKPRSRTADFAVYCVIRLAAAFLRALPFPLANRVAIGLAWIMMTISPRRVQVARDNLHLAFPELAGADIERMVGNVYRHFCRVLVEIIRLDRLLRANNWRDHFEFESLEEYRCFSGPLISGRPVMMVTAHFGNFEVATYLLAMLGFGGYVIARPLDNVFLDRWMHRWRESTGQKLIAKNGEFGLIEYALRNGKILATVGDQDAGQRGVFVNFFNRPASTHKAIALLALEHQATMIVGGFARLSDGLHYRVHAADIIYPEEYAGHPDPVTAITVRFTQGLERLIRRYPEQYFWFHRRWKHQPLPAKKQKAA